MKFNIEIDATPEEVRRLVGLPDMSPVHEAYLGKMKGAIDKGVTPDVVSDLVKTWMPGSGQGIDFVRDLMTSVTKATSSGSSAGGKKS